MPDFPILTLIIFLSVLHGRAARMGTFSMVMTRLPSVLAHELSHMVMGLATFAGVESISLFPKRVPDGWVLGSVQCSKLGIFNSFPVAMAPLMINIPLAWWMFHLHTTLGYIGAFLFITSSVPSDQDLKVATSSNVGLMVWGCVLAAVYSLWRGIWVL